VLKMFCQLISSQFFSSKKKIFTHDDLFTLVKKFLYNFGLKRNFLYKCQIDELEKEEIVTKKLFKLLDKNFTHSKSLSC
jgi:hypothetical protein